MRNLQVHEGNYAQNGDVGILWGMFSVVIIMLTFISLSIPLA